MSISSMPSAKGSATGGATTSARSRPPATGKSNAAGNEATLDTGALATFFADLARRISANPALAREVAGALSASGLLGVAGDAQSGTPGMSAGTTEETAIPPKRASRRTGARAAHVATAQPLSEARAVLDPYAILRTGGEDGLRRALEACAPADLQRIIRAHRLDPARISARWSAHDRLLALIIDRVQARANHGRAFERV